MAQHFAPDFECLPPTFDSFNENFGGAYLCFIFMISIQLMVELRNIPSKEEQIVTMLKHGCTYETISKFLNVSKSSISYLKKRIDSNSFSPCIQTPNKREICRNELEALRIEFPNASDSKIAELIKRNLGIEISRSTINRIEHALNFKYLPLKHKQNLTESQKRNRVLFSYNILKEGINGEDIIFSDESRFVLGTDRHWVWRRRGEDVPGIYEACDKFPKSVMVFGAIGNNFKSTLVIVKTSIDAFTYQRILVDSKVIEYLSLPESKNLILQQDGASCHKASVGFIRKYCNFLDKWPSNSPDLNVIEHLWAILKRKVEEVNPSNLDALVDTIMEAWDSISITTINSLVNSFPRRCAICLKLNGESINGHFADSIDIPAKENLEQIHSLEDDHQCLVLKKFTEEEAIAFEESIKKKNEAPNWDEKMDRRLFKYIVDMGLTFKEASKRFKTNDIESVKNRFKEICSQHAAHQLY